MTDDGNIVNKRELIDRCLTHRGAFEDYPFDENWACIRHSGNRKIFAFIYEREGGLYVNLKCEPVRADVLRQIYSGVLPGYHMNKEHWNTVVMCGDVPDGELFEMVCHSYKLTEPKERKAKF